MGPLRKPHFGLIFGNKNDSFLRHFWLKNGSKMAIFEGVWPGPDQVSRPLTRPPKGAWSGAEGQLDTASG